MYAPKGKGRNYEQEGAIVNSAFCCGCHEFDGFGCDRSPMKYCLKCEKCLNFSKESGKCKTFPVCEFESLCTLEE